MTDTTTLGSRGSGGTALLVLEPSTVSESPREVAAWISVRQRLEGRIEEMDEEARDNHEATMDPAARDVALELAEQIALPGGAPSPGIFLGDAGDAILIYDTADETRRYYLSVMPGGSELKLTLVSGCEVQGPLSLPVRPDMLQKIAVLLNES